MRRLARTVDQMPKPATPPRPYRIAITLEVAKPVLERLKREARAIGVTLDELVSARIAGAPLEGPKPDRRGKASNTPDVCRHLNTRPEPKIPGLRVCVECGTRVT